MMSPRPARTISFASMSEMSRGNESRSPELPPLTAEGTLQQGLVTSGDAVPPPCQTEKNLLLPLRPIQAQQREKLFVGDTPVPNKATLKWSIARGLSNLGRWEPCRRWSPAGVRLARDSFTIIAQSQVWARTAPTIWTANLYYASPKSDVLPVLTWGRSDLNLSHRSI